ncbi:MAG: hypothetical protein WA364_29820 [Candidatus Nitrosopolaris sp.]
MSESRIRSKRHDAVNQMPIVVEDPVSYTDVLKEKQRSCKRILIVDDEADVTISFKAVLEDSNSYYYANTRIEVYSRNHRSIQTMMFSFDTHGRELYQ